MADRIQLVQGDTLPKVVVLLFKDDGSGPMDLREATVTMKFSESGSDTPKEILNGALLNGYDDGSGNISFAPPYDQVNGRGGRVEFSWSPTSLDTQGSFEGEVRVSFDGGLTQTAYEKIKFFVR